MAATVLIIEDDHDIRVGLREALEHEGFIVYTAADGRAGLSLLARIAIPCVILLDQAMPIMNGEEFMENMNRDKTLSGIPVIVLSANNDPPDSPRRQGLFQQAVRYKPRNCGGTKVLWRARYFGGCSQIVVMSFDWIEAPSASQCRTRLVLGPPRNSPGLM